MTDRIELLLKSLNLSPSRFADEINVQRSSVSHILSGRNKPSLDFITKVLEAYPQINPDWLLFNRGRMIRNAQTAPEEVSKESPKEPSDDKLETLSPPASDRVDSEERILPQNEESPPNGWKQPDEIILLYADGSFKSYKPG